jgi:hypothetical protein
VVAFLEDGSGEPSGHAAERGEEVDDASSERPRTAVPPGVSSARVLIGSSPIGGSR